VSAKVAGETIRRKDEEHLGHHNKMLEVTKNIIDPIEETDTDYRYGSEW